MNKKALLLPYNSKNELFLQDRRGYKAPDWGFFGGGVEKGETVMQALIRETKQELDLDITEADVELLGEFPIETESETVQRTLYLYRTDQEKFTVKEGPGGHWLSYGGCNKRLEENEKFDELWAKIGEVTQ